MPRSRVPVRSGQRLLALAEATRWRALVPSATVAVVALATEFAVRTLAQSVLTGAARALTARRTAGAVATAANGSVAGRARHFTRTVITEITVIERARRRR